MRVAAAVGTASDARSDPSAAPLALLPTWMTFVVCPCMMMARAGAVVWAA